MNRIFGPDRESQVEGEPFDVSRPDRFDTTLEFHPNVSRNNREAVMDPAEKGETVVIINVSCSAHGQRYAVWHYRPDGWLDPL